MMTPEQQADAARADWMTLGACSLLVLAAAAYRARGFLGEAWLAWREAAAAPGAASRVPARWAVGLASVSLVLFLYGGALRSRLPSDSCGSALTR